MAQPKQNIWAQRAMKVFGLPGLVALIPFALLGAHYVRGADADDPSNTYLYALIFIAISLMTFGVSKFRAATPGLAAAALVFGGWVALGLSGNWAQARPEVISLIAAGAIFLAGRCAGQSSETLSFAWRTLIWSWLLFTVLALIGHITNYTGDPMQSGAYDATRLRAGFVSPNSTATLLSMAVIMCTAKLLYAVNHASSDVKSRQDFVDYIFRASLTTIVVFALAMSCLWLTGSRFVTVLCILSVIYLVETEYKSYRGRRIRLGRGQKVVRTLIYAVLIVAAITAFVGDLLVDRTMEATSSAPRKLDLFGIYGSVWLEKPWFGHGLGSFNRVNDALMTLENVGTTGAFGAAHNVVLQWLIQQGIVGTILICTLFATLHVPLIRAMRQQTRRSKTFLRASLCLSCLVILHSMLDYALEIPSIMWTYAFMLGLAHGRSSTLIGIKIASVEQTEEKTGAADNDLVVA